MWNWRLAHDNLCKCGETLAYTKQARWQTERRKYRGRNEETDDDKMMSRLKLIADQLAPLGDKGLAKDLVQQAMLKLTPEPPLQTKAERMAKTAKALSDRTDKYSRLTSQWHQAKRKMEELREEREKQAEEILDLERTLKTIQEEGAEDTEKTQPKGGIIKQLLEINLAQLEIEELTPDLEMDASDLDDQAKAEVAEVQKRLVTGMQEQVKLWQETCQARMSETQKKIKEDSAKIIQEAKKRRLDEGGQAAASPAKAAAAQSSEEKTSQDEGKAKEEDKAKGSKDKKDLKKTDAEEIKEEEEAMLQRLRQQREQAQAVTKDRAQQ